jgi:hypothetical protein
MLLQSDYCLSESCWSFDWTYHRTCPFVLQNCSAIRSYLLHYLWSNLCYDFASLLTEVSLIFPAWSFSCNHLLVVSQRLRRVYTVYDVCQVDFMNRLQRALFSIFHEYLQLALASYRIKKLFVWNDQNWLKARQRCQSKSWSFQAYDHW